MAIPQHYARDGRAVACASVFGGEVCVGLFWHIIDLFWHIIGLFWHIIGLFLYVVGIFWYASVHTVACASVFGGDMCVYVHTKRDLLCAKRNLPPVNTDFVHTKRDLSCAKRDLLYYISLTYLKATTPIIPHSPRDFAAYCTIHNQHT